MELAFGDMSRSKICLSILYGKSYSAPSVTVTFWIQIAQLENFSTLALINSYFLYFPVSVFPVSVSLVEGCKISINALTVVVARRYFLKGDLPLPADVELTRGVM